LQPVGRPRKHAPKIFLFASEKNYAETASQSNEDMRKEPQLHIWVKIPYLFPRILGSPGAAGPVKWVSLMPHLPTQKRSTLNFMTYYLSLACALHSIPSSFLDFCRVSGVVKRSKIKEQRSARFGQSTPSCKPPLSPFKTGNHTWKFAVALFVKDMCMKAT